MTNRQLEFPFSKPADMALDRYLLTLLVAAVKQSGGALTLPSKIILESEEETLVKYPSDNMTELVLRSAPKGTDILRASWETIQSKQPVQIRPPRAQSSTIDDMRLAMLEEEQAQVEQSGRYPFRTMPNPPKQQ